MLAQHLVRLPVLVVLVFLMATLLVLVAVMAMTVVLLVLVTQQVLVAIQGRLELRTCDGWRGRERRRTALRNRSAKTKGSARTTVGGIAGRAVPIDTLTVRAPIAPSVICSRKPRPLQFFFA